MKKILFTLSAQILLICQLNAQVFQVDTIQYKGDINKYINIVILGDGYTAAQQVNFIADATNLSGYLLGQSPFSEYIDYFNVFVVRVISNQSGAAHPGTAGDCGTASPTVPVSNPSTYLGCSFDSYGIHRLIVPANTANVANVLATNFPNYDLVLILANTPYYGGSGGAYATATLESSSPEIVAHETGHSFAMLADEYYAGDVYASEKANMTQQTDSSLVKWTNWIGTNNIGIFQHCCGGQSASWYRPHNNCKMRLLGPPYCAVCSEAIIEKIHSLVNTIVNYTPLTLTINSPAQMLDFKLTTLMKPVPNTLKIVWTLDGTNVLNDVDSVSINQNILTIGLHTLTATVFDTTTMVRVNSHSTVHFNSITWTINKTTTGVQLTSDGNTISYSVFPNPSANILNISVESDKQLNKAIVQIISADGKIVKEVANEEFIKGKYLKSINIENLPAGTYYVVLKSQLSSQALTFVKP